MTAPVPSSGDQPGLPLEGMRIIELSSFVASPLAGMVLAELGAEVIRIDPLGGAPDRERWPLESGGESLYWASLNKGKRSVTVDLRSDAGRRLVADLVDQSGPGGGIVLTNAREVHGFEVDSLRRRRPDLIHLRLVGRRGGGSSVDYTANARSGFAMVTGPEGFSGPVNHVVPVWDVTAGLYLATGLLAAERRRGRTGQGQVMELALDDVALATAANLGLLAEAATSPAARPRIGNQIYGDLGRDFRTKDGVHVMLVVITQRQWRDLVTTLGLGSAVLSLEHRLSADFRKGSDRFEHRGVLNDLIGTWFEERSYMEVERALGAADLLWSRFASFAEVAESVSCTRAGLLSYVHHPGMARHIAAGSPLVVEGVQVPAECAPALGEHTTAVLSDLLHLSSSEIDDLVARGVVG